MAIDEKKLIEDMLNNDGIDFRMDFNTDTEESVLESLREFADRFRQGMIELVQKQPKVGEWIPCSERLPKETDFPEQKYRILASCSDGIVRNATIENLNDRSKKHFNGSQCEFAYLAWQPLPEPYKE